MTVPSDASARFDSSDPDPSRERDIPEENLYLTLIQTADRLSRNIDDLMKTHGLTQQQYNVLRILFVRGSSGLRCQDIAERLITRVPDVTRLLDRLDERGLITRRRPPEDRRVVLVSLTDRGKELCRTIDQDLVRLHREQLGHLEKSEIETLRKLLERVSKPFDAS